MATKLTLKQIKEIARTGRVNDITSAPKNFVKEPLNLIGISCGVYGCNGKLFQGEHTKELYVIIGRCSNIFYY